jgi:hypothetical protein
MLVILVVEKLKSHCEHTETKNGIGIADFGEQIT